MKLVTQLNDQINFSSNEKIIANYILKHLDEVTSMSIQELAKKTYTSTSSIMRLCTRLNISGFKELKLNLLQEGNEVENNNTPLDPNFPFSLDSSTAQIASSINNLTVQSLNEAQNLLSISDLNKAASILYNANHIGLFGLGDAHVAGLSFQMKMMQIGINCVTTSIPGEQNLQCGALKKGDAAILISYSGAMSPTIFCAKELKKNKVSTIGICSDPNSSLAKLCDITLILPGKEERMHRIGAFFSQACMDYCLNVLYSKIYVLSHKGN